MSGMPLRPIALVAAMSCLVGCGVQEEERAGSVVLSEQSRDLGFGYRAVRQSQEVNIPFESVGHFGYLYYRDRQLSSTTDYSISPDGKYAILQDGPTGSIMLFNAETGELSVVVPEFRGLVDIYHGFEWDPEAKTVTVNVQIAAVRDRQVLIVWFLPGAPEVGAGFGRGC